MTGSTMLNPAIGFALQIVAAVDQMSPSVLLGSLTLLIPSLAGGFAGGLIMTRLYEPLLLSIKYKELFLKSGITEAP